MSTKILFRTAAFFAAALLSVACIYPYKVDIQKGGDYPMVIEGDIHIGGITTLKLSYVRPFNPDSNELPTVYARGYVEGEDGSRVDGTYDTDYLSSSTAGGKSVLSFDTSKLRENQQYRLVFETLGQGGTVQNRYESEWLTPCPAPTIDGLSYSKQEDHFELWIGLSMHCNGAQHFRWSFVETWEYHSELKSTYEYTPREWKMNPNTWRYELVGGGYYTYRFDAPRYYCWRTVESSQINLFSTANQTEDRFEDLAFHTIPLNDNRLQCLYRITVQLEALSENAYNYWSNIQQNSEGQGSIFAPVPSEMASNVHCVSDPSIQVMGYLNAAAQVTAVMYYDNIKERFYKPDPPEPRDTEEVEAGDVETADELYDQRHMLPYDGEYKSPTAFEPTHYLWTYARCIDCTLHGGSKDRPEDWPSGNF